MSNEKNYLSLPLLEFLEDVAARKAMPGGGSVAALVGAEAVCLARMAVVFTLGKPETAAHEDRLQETLRDLVKTQEEFQHLITEDMVAYKQLKEARKSAAGNLLPRALEAAIAVPMENVVLAGAVLARLDDVKACLNPLLSSDLRAAAILADAAAQAAGVTARGNIDSMQDRKQAHRLEDQLDLLLGRAHRHRNNIVHYQAESS